MSLREHLRHLLPEILPPAPKNAIKGTELIELVKSKLDQKYSDATLRYHFSIMSCDPVRVLSTERIPLLSLVFAILGPSEDEWNWRRGSIITA